MVVVTDAMIQGFVAGVVTALASAWAYWKSIPVEKKKAAFVQVKESIADGKITATEAMETLEKLFF